MTLCQTIKTSYIYPFLSWGLLAITVESKAVGLVLLVLRGWGVSSFGFFLPEAYNASVQVGVGQVKFSAGWRRFWHWWRVNEDSSNKYVHREFSNAITFPCISVYYLLNWKYPVY